MVGMRKHREMHDIQQRWLNFVLDSMPLRAVLRSYLNPPQHAAVFYFDESGLFKRNTGWTRYCRCHQERRASRLPILSFTACFSVYAALDVLVLTHRA